LTVPNEPPIDGTDPAANADEPAIDGADPADEFRKRSQVLRSDLSDFFRFVPIILYFFVYWTPKEYVRHALRIGALSFLSISAVLLWLEVAAEFAQGQVIHLFVPRAPLLKWGGLALFSVSIVSLLIHHHHERKHRDSEFHLAERMWEFMIKRKTKSWDECIALALPLFFDVFSRCKIRHLSIGLPDTEYIKIEHHHVYPAETDPSYFHALPVKRSVAGRVYADGRVRYVPRLFFPFNSRRRYPWTARFNHAMVFEIKQTADKRLDIFRPKLNVNSFDSAAIANFVFKSFVTVPLEPRDSSERLGVLNIDFDTTDPLDRIHIKMAAFLGVVLADELHRIKHARQEPSPAPA
jgi:hypothetical protein